MLQIKKVSVLGAGLMGNQIAMQIALHGYQVVCYDISEVMLQKAADFSADWFSRRVKKGKMGAEEAAEIQSRLHFTTDVRTAAADADIVMEAVSDIVQIKKSALSNFDQYTPDHCIYASNSSYIVSSRVCRCSEGSLESDQCALF